jgi:hypothetical protein
LTGFSENISEEKAETIEIKGLLIKPVVMESLSERIRKMVDTNKL